MKHDLVRGLPNFDVHNDKVCDACQLGKHARSSFKTKSYLSTSKPLELLHIDLFGPVVPMSLGGKAYAFVIVDDFTPFSWTLFLTHKNDAFESFENLIKKLENKLSV